MLVFLIFFSVACYLSFEMQKNGFFSLHRFYFYIKLISLLLKMDCSETASSRSEFSPKLLVWQHSCFLGHILAMKMPLRSESAIAANLEGFHAIMVYASF